MDVRYVGRHASNLNAGAQPPRDRTTLAELRGTAGLCLVAARQGAVVQFESDAADPDVLQYTYRHSAVWEGRGGSRTSGSEVRSRSGGMWGPGG